MRALVVTLLALAFPAAALADDAQTLAQRYSPVVRLVAQAEPPLLQAVRWSDAERVAYAPTA